MGGPPSTAIDNNDEDNSRDEMDVPDSPSMNKSGKLKPFEEDPQSKTQFEKQLVKLVENVLELTPYTIYGLSIKSEFSIAV